MTAGTPVAPFDAAAIRAQLSVSQRRLLGGLTLLDQTDSTNRVLARLPPAARHGHAVLADSQTAGRGRRERHWHSPPGGNLYLSLGWRFALAPSALAMLPLACAVIAAHELEGADVRQLGIKWPNDLYGGGRKLGGLLVESQVSGRESTDVIIGIGINVRMPQSGAADGAIGQAWTDVVSLCDGDPGPDLRDRLAGRIVGALLDGLGDFAERGFAPFRAGWDRLDLLRGRPVTVASGADVVEGTVLGLSDTGALRVRIEAADGENAIREFLAADVSVRAAKPAALRDDDHPAQIAQRIV